MNWFQNRKLMTKMTLGFLVVCALVAVMGVLSGRGVLGLRENLRIVYEDYTVAGTDLAKTAGQLMKYRNTILLALGAAERQDFEQRQAALAGLRKGMLESLDKYANTQLRVSKSGRDEKQDLERFRKMLDEYFPTSETVMALEAERWAAADPAIAKQKHEVAQSIATSKAGPQLNTTVEALEQLVDTVSDVAADMNQDGKQTAANALWTMAIGSLLAIVLSMTIGYFLARLISRPLQTTIAVLDAVAKGDLNKRVDIDTSDELGQVAKSVNGMVADLAVQRERERQVAAEKQQAAEELQSKVDSILGVVNAAAGGDLTQEITVEGEDAIGQMGCGLKQFLGQLRSSIGSIALNAQGLATSSEELSSVSVQLSANAEETSAQSNVVSAASEQVSKNVQTVATGVEEMGASIREIAGNANQAAKVAQQAVKVAETTNATIAKLGESSSEIGKVIKVITSIAEQTNLLALNATIEAARAGEAGKGFAVVANEVKELAKETAKATEDIGQKIDAIQSDTRGAVDAIKQISQIIGQINDISNTIASAVEEQTATTNEIARNVSEAAKGSGEIAQNNTSVAKAAESTTEGAGNTQQAAAELSRMAAELQQLVSRFKYAEDKLTPVAATRSSRTPASRNAVLAG